MHASRAFRIYKKWSTPDTMGKNIIVFNTFVQRCNTYVPHQLEQSYYAGRVEDSFSK